MGFTLGRGHPFPAGTLVTAYEDIGQQPQGAPNGLAVIDTAIVAADLALTLTFDDLAAEKRYYAVAQVGSTWRWVSFRTVSDAITTTDLAAHEADTTNIHGIADMIALNARVNAHTGGIFSVLEYGALGDGAIGAGGITGTDDTAAFQAAVDAAHTSGGGVVFVPGGRAYRINGKVLGRKGVYFLGTPGASAGGPNPQEATDYYNDATGQFVVPKSSMPTILVTSTTVSPFEIFGAGCGAENFCTLYPNQVKPTAAPNYSGAPIVYPPTFDGTTSSANGRSVKNIVDYNSYRLIDGFGGADIVFEGIHSSTWGQIIRTTSDEVSIRHVFYNGGTVYQDGGNKHPAGPLIEVDNAGPINIHDVGMNGTADSSTGIKITTKWGFRLSDVWLDQHAQPLDIVHKGVAGEQNTIYGHMENVECGKGNTLGGRIRFRGGQGSGANVVVVQATNCIFAKPFEVSMADATQSNGGLFKASNCTWYEAFTVSGPTGGGDALTIDCSGCTFGPSRFTATGTGRVRIYLSATRRSQNFPGTGYEDSLGAGPADMQVLDRDALETTHLHLPEGLSLANGNNYIGNLPIPHILTGKTALTVVRAKFKGRVGDKIQLRNVSGGSVTLPADPYDLVSMAAASQQIGVTTPNADPPYGSIVALQRWQTADSGQVDAHYAEIHYFNASGGAHVVPAGGYDVWIEHAGKGSPVQ